MEFRKRNAKGQITEVLPPFPFAFALFMLVLSFSLSFRELALPSIILFFIFSIGIAILRDPFWALLVMVILIPLEEIVGISGGRTLIFYLGLILVVIWVFHLVIGRGKITLLYSATILAGMWILWGTFSFFWATSQELVLTKLRILIQLVGFFILIQSLITDRKRLSLLLGCYFFTTVTLSLWSIFIANTHVFNRLSLSESQNPAHFAQNLGLGLLLTPFLLKVSKGRILRIIVLLGSFSLTIAILQTGTRAVWVGLILAFPLVWISTRRKIIRFRWLLLALILLVMGIPILNKYEIISDYIVERIVTLTDIEATHGGAGRKNIWAVGLGMIKEKPFLGVGLGNFPFEFSDYVKLVILGDRYGINQERDPHSIYLSIWAETGLPGLLIMFAFFGSLFTAVRKHKNRPESIVAISMFFFILVSGTFITIQYRKYFWLVMGICAVVPLVNRKE